MSTIEEIASSKRHHELITEITPEVEAHVLGQLKAGVAVDTVTSNPVESKFVAKVVRHDPNKDIPYPTHVIAQATASDQATARLRALYIAKHSKSIAMPVSTEQQMQSQIAELQAMVARLMEAPKAEPVVDEPIVENPIDDMDKEELIATLERHGVEVDKRLGADKLRALLADTLRPSN